MKYCYIVFDKNVYQSKPILVAEDYDDAVQLSSQINSINEKTIRENGTSKEETGIKRVIFIPYVEPKCGDDCGCCDQAPRF